MSGLRDLSNQLFEPIYQSQSTNPLSIENSRRNNSSLLARMQSLRSTLIGLRTQLTSPSIQAFAQSNPSQAQALKQTIESKIQELTQRLDSTQKEFTDNLSAFTSINTLNTDLRRSNYNFLSQNASKGVPLAVSEVYLNAINNRTNNSQLENVLATI
jgi:hypothetical protein